MTAFNVILLAGGEKGPLYAPTGYLEKALIPIHGEAMLSRVIGALHRCPLVDQLVVVGSPRLDELEAMQHVRKRVFTGLNVVQNLLHAVTYVKYRLYDGRTDHPGYVISFCDAVFLTPQIVQATLQRITAEDADVVLHYVQRSAFEEAGLPTQRTYLKVAGMELTGTAIYYVRRFKQVFSIMPQLVKLRKHRKHPKRFLELIGCHSEMSLQEVETAISERLGIHLRIVLSPHPELGMDVDKPADLKLAEQLLT